MRFYVNYSSTSTHPTTWLSLPPIVISQPLIRATAEVPLRHVRFTLMGESVYQRQVRSWATAE